MSQTLAQVPGVTRTAAIIRGRVMASANDSSNVAEVFGVSRADLEAMPRIVDPQTSVGTLDDFDQGHRDRFGNCAGAGCPGWATRSG